MAMEMANLPSGVDGSAALVGKELAFSDIKYSVKLAEKQEDGSDTKDILHGVSGVIQGGTMMCCLGPSGSGKTSLIHIVAGRIKTTSNGSHQVGGLVTVDNERLNSTQFQRISGLVTQEDVFNSALTVGETIKFAAALRLHRDFREERIEDVISSLQLESCRETFIGDDANPYMKGISGGEKRRTAIALELLDPNIKILVLDEPTSGLDAAAAQNVVNVLRALADGKKMAVLTTLHQPRGSIMGKFESVMVLSGGKMIYNGERAAFASYMEDSLQCSIPLHESPYDVMLDVLNPAIAKEGDVPTIGVISSGSSGAGGKDDSSSVGDQLSALYLKSDMHRAVTAKVKASESTAAEDTDEGACNAASWLQQFSVLLHRTFLVKLRDVRRALGFAFPH